MSRMEVAGDIAWGGRAAAAAADDDDEAFKEGLFSIVLILVSCYFI